jgi:hypothetical protein
MMYAYMSFWIRADCHPKTAMVLEEKIGRCGHRSAALSIIIDIRFLKVPDLQAKRFIIKDSTDAPNLSANLVAA